MSRVFLIGHHPDVRAALALAITDQGQGTLVVVGEACAMGDDLAAIHAAQPDVLVIVLGFETSGAHMAVQAIRRQSPSCRVVIIDTAEETSDWMGYWEGHADVLLQAEQLATDLVPAICRLVA